jgi:hypothetical protein
MKNSDISQNSGKTDYHIISHYAGVWRYAGWVYNPGGIRDKALLFELNKIYIVLKQITTIKLTVAQ